MWCISRLEVAVLSNSANELLLIVAKYVVFGGKDKPM